MNDSTPAKLLKFSVENLYGLYNHCIEFSSNSENICILHGPNGVGKTALLRCIDYLFSSDFGSLSKVPFSRINVDLDSGYSVVVLRLGAVLSDLASRNMNHLAKLEVSIYLNDKSLAKHTFSTPRLRSEKLNYSSIYDDLTSEGNMLRQRLINQLNNIEVARVESGIFNGEEAVTVVAGGGKNKKRLGASYIKDFLKCLSVHFVETNRLYRQNTNVKISNSNIASSHMVLTVQECAKDLTIRIGTVLKDYGVKSQLLDQSFPQRFISESLSSMGVEEIKDKLSLIGKKLKDLRTIGLLDVDSVQAFDIEALDFVDENKIEVMSLYVRDSESKLRVFDSLLSRVQLLLWSIETKFRNKKVFLSKGRGFYVKLDSGDELPLDALSSGEQHELVLMYELLFKVPAGTLVLVDEPELSLHVSWQKAFLPELISIAKEVGFTAIVATHSPFIVGDRYDLMIALDAEQEHE